MDEEYEGNRMIRVGVEGKERKTEAEVDGQCKCRLGVEGTVGGADA